MPEPAKNKKKGSADMDKIPYIMDSVINVPWAILPSTINSLGSYLVLSIVCPCFKNC